MKLFVFFTVFSILSPCFAEKKKGDVVIINSSETQSQSVTAPALTPSKANELRKAREEAEIETESHILEKLETERLKNEQSRMNELLGGKTERVEEATSPVISSPEPQWYFGEKAFISLGGGYVSYFGGNNVKSTNRPAVFISLGGYAKKYFIFDFTGYYSKHFLEVGDSSGSVYYGVNQISGSFSLKISPLSGRLKPYGGVVGAYTGRSYKLSSSEGELLEGTENEVTTKDWWTAFDVGPTIGVDVALGPRLGFNVGFWWLLNVTTEEADSNDYTVPLSKKDSIVISGNVRFYF